ncbi:MAG TPA: hypothetical protein VFV94_13320, partial [Polyangiaceae bacterium]|nr:hypothetical protein [Polyangiaceae bacterium]
MIRNSRLWAGLARSAAAAGAVTWGCAAPPGVKTAPLATERSPQTLELLVGAELNLGTPAASLAGVPHMDQALATNAAGTTLVVWVVNYDESADVYGARVDADGTVLDLNAIAIAAAPYEAAAPAVASDGSGWLVAWEQARKDQTRGIYATRVAASGDVLDAGGFAVAPSPNAYNLTPSIAFDGTNYLVAWTAPNSIMNSQNQWANAIYATRLDTSGVVLDANGVFLGASLPGMTLGVPRPSLAFDGTSWVVVWSTFTGATNFDVIAQRYTTGLSSVGGSVIAGTANDETRPNVHCAGVACFVAWERGGIFGTRLSGGTVLDPGGIAIGPYSGSPLRAPGVAFDGTNWAVAWRETNGASNSVQAARISTAGTVLDSPFALGDAMEFPPSSAAGVALGDGDGRPFAAWGAAHGGTDSAFIADDGKTTEASLISWQPKRGSAAEAAASNGDYLVVWQDERLGWPAIFGTRISPTGELRDPNGIQISGGHSREYEPAVASDGTDWLVVWKDYRNGTDYDIYGTRVTAGGSV